VELRRRDLIATACAGTIVASPFSARAQDRPRRVGVLTGLTESDPATVARLAAFREGMAAAGWREGHNLTIDTRYAPNTPEISQRLIAELLAQKPDLLVAQGPSVAAAQQATSTVPIVMVVLPDPVGAKVVASLAHPGGNITGFTSTEPSFGAKWIELLHEVKPDLKRVMVLWHNDVTMYQSNFADAARHFAVEVVQTHVETADEIEPTIAFFAKKPDGGLVLPTDAFTAINRKAIIELSLRHRLPLVTGNPPFPEDGGLMFYGADIIDIYRRAAVYVDRILKGAVPGELPVQQPTTLQLVINLKTAAALGLQVPDSLRVRADQVIE
jgi:putative ABC transport system substrate-binding protein